MSWRERNNLGASAIVVFVNYTGIPLGVPRTLALSTRLSYLPPAKEYYTPSEVIFMKIRQKFRAFRCIFTVQCGISLWDRRPAPGSPRRFAKLVGRLRHASLRAEASRPKRGKTLRRDAVAPRELRLAENQSISWHGLPSAISHAITGHDSRE